MRASAYTIPFVWSEQDKNKDILCSKILLEVSLHMCNEPFLGCRGQFEIFKIWQIMSLTCACGFSFMLCFLFYKR